MNSPPYYKYSQYLKNKYGEKVYKLPVNLPITCPNRIGGSGCTFCADVGTGFEASESFKSVREQLTEGKEHIQKKYGAKKFIAYFQNYTNTFMPIEKFEEYVEEAATQKDVLQIAVSTRPDCLKVEYLEVLARISQEYRRDIHIELGLQSANYHTLTQINRGHGLAEYIDAVLTIQKYPFTICTHVILNLPGDSMEDVTETAKIVSALKTDVIKVHSLYIAKDTKLCEAYEAGEVTVCDKKEYLHRACTFLEYLAPDIAVERLFSRIPRKDAVFSNWGYSWWRLYDELIMLMNKKGAYQGKQFNYLGGSALDKL